MKCFFICDWDYTLLWEKVAKQFKEKGIANECSALIVGQIYYDQLLTDQTQPFRHVYLLQKDLETFPEGVPNLDSRIQALEEKYSDARLWRYVWADRSWVFCKHEEIKKRLVLCFDYFEALYEKEKPDVILANAYASMPHLISYTVATRLGIPMLRPMSVRLQDRYIISDNAMEDESWIKQYLSGDRQVTTETKTEAEQFLASFRDKAVAPHFQLLRGREHHVTPGHVYRLLRYSYHFWFKKSFSHDHTKLNPFQRLMNELRWRFYRKKYSKQYYWDKWNEKTPYVYFPLHVQPEMSTMTFAPFYLNQLAILENLSKSLPIGYRLVVKEHPSMLGRRSFDYYHQIKRLPNVCFVHPLMNNFEVIRHARLVFTITGTAGLEGLLLKKPVIMLGASYYRYCPLVFNAKHVAPVDWSVLIDRALNEYQHDDEVLKLFLGAVFSRSFNGVYVEPLAALDKVLDDDNINVLIKAFCVEFARRFTENKILQETSNSVV